MVTFYLQALEETIHEDGSIRKYIVKSVVIPLDFKDDQIFVNTVEHMIGEYGRANVRIYRENEYGFLVMLDNTYSYQGKFLL